MIGFPLIVEHEIGDRSLDEVGKAKRGGHS